MIEISVTLYSLVLLLSGFVSFVLFGILFCRRKERGALLLALAMLAEAAWAFTEGLEALSVPLSQKIFFSKLGYLSVYNCLPLFSLFILVYTDFYRPSFRRFLPLLWVVPTIMIGLVMGNEQHHLVWTGFVPGPDPSQNMYLYLRGPLYWLGVFYNYGLLVGMTILVLWKAFHTRSFFSRWQSVIALSSIFPPWLANALYLFALEPLKGLDFTPAAFALTGLMLFIGIYRFRFLDISPLARDVLFERIKDGILVLDSNNQVVDVNAAAQQLFSLSAREILQQPGANVLRVFPGLFERLQASSSPFQAEFMLNVSPSRQFDVDVSRLYSDQENFEGRLITFSEITARKRVEATEREQRRLAEALRNVGVAITSTLDYNEVLDRILENIYEVLPCLMTNLMLIDERGYAHVARCKGYIRPDLYQAVMTAELWVDEADNLYQMQQSGQPRTIVDTMLEKNWKYRDPMLRSYVGAPICIKGKVVGFINLDHSQPGFYTQEHATVLQSFADLAAIAIENARLYTRATELATLDELTQLNNRRHFFALAENEVNRALRYGTVLSVVMMDLDYFKEINDTYGHHAGDLALQEVAVVFQSTLREMDIAGRYGGDELCLTLPETNEEGAWALAQRLLELIRQIKVDVGGKRLHITASIGVASLSPEDRSLTDLLQKADRALYRSKEQGRDQAALYR
ncbi:MAG: diguanylate cyclase [Bacteroidales bacterium]